MKKQPHRPKSILQSQVTATISVALVLLMIGIIALAGLTARGVARSIADEVGFTVVIADSLDANGARAIGCRLQAQPSSSRVAYVSAEQVLARWNAMLGTADSLLDANPFLPEWEVKVREPWTHPDSLRRIVADVRTWSGVSDATFYDDMAEAVDSSLSTITLILIVLTAVLALISFVLISNTVRLAVYSRRLTIHAMRLVGAKGSFIRRPFIVSSLIGGLLAASVASAILLGALFYIARIYTPLFTWLSVTEIALTFGFLYLTGALICVAAAIFATNRYLRSDYDDLFN